MVRCDSTGREVDVAAFAAAVVVAAVAVAFAAVVAAGIDLIDAEEIATGVGVVDSAAVVASFAAGCCYFVPDAVVVAFVAVAVPAAEVVVDLPSFEDSFLAARRLLSPSALPVPSAVSGTWRRCSSDCAGSFHHVVAQLAAAYAAGTGVCR